LKRTNKKTGDKLLSKPATRGLEHNENRFAEKDNDLFGYHIRETRSPQTKT
jgi:hypothetical protein